MRLPEKPIVYSPNEHYYRHCRERITENHARINQLSIALTRVTSERIKKLMEDEQTLLHKENYILSLNLKHAGYAQD